MTLLQCQVHTSETLLQDLQKSVSQSQNAVQSRLVRSPASVKAGVDDIWVTWPDEQEVEEHYLYSQTDIYNTSSGHYIPTLIQTKYTFSTYA